MYKPKTIQIPLHMSFVFHTFDYVPIALKAFKNSINVLRIGNDLFCVHLLAKEEQWLIIVEASFEYGTIQRIHIDFLIFSRLSLCSQRFATD